MFGLLSTAKICIHLYKYYYTKYKHYMNNRQFTYQRYYSCGTALTDSELQLVTKHNLYSHFSRYSHRGTDENESNEQFISERNETAHSNRV
jgi:hypothetical protein